MASLISFFTSLAEDVQIIEKNLPPVVQPGRSIANHKRAPDILLLLQISDVIKCILFILKAVSVYWFVRTQGLVSLN